MLNLIFKSVSFSFFNFLNEQVRVDFNQTQMLPPRRGFCIDQYLTVSGSAVVPAVNKFCGNNADQHCKSNVYCQLSPVGFFFIYFVCICWCLAVYLELAEAGANARTLDFNVVTQIEGIAYNYSLIIQQIDCREQPLLLPSPPPSSQLKGDEPIRTILRSGGGGRGEQAHQAYCRHQFPSGK